MHRSISLFETQKGLTTSHFHTQLDPFALADDIFYTILFKIQKDGVQVNGKGERIRSSKDGERDGKKEIERENNGYIDKLNILLTWII